MSGSWQSRRARATELSEMCGVAANLVRQVCDRLPPYPPELNRAAQHLDRALDELLIARAKLEEAARR